MKIVGCQLFHCKIYGYFYSVVNIIYNLVEALLSSFFIYLFIHFEGEVCGAGRGRYEVFEFK